MEEAIILTMLSPNFTVEDLDTLREERGIDSAYFIYGPYDLFIKIKVESRNELREVVNRLRSMNGIKSTVTCNVIS